VIDTHCEELVILDTIVDPIWRKRSATHPPAVEETHFPSLKVAGCEQANNLGDTLE
jgi:hypothetical protein